MQLIFKMEESFSVKNLLMLEIKFQENEESWEWEKNFHIIFNTFLYGELLEFLLC